MTEDEKTRKLAELCDRIQRDPQYRNERMGDRFVPGKGSLREGSVVFIGEAPGREEERAQMPFVGAAGRNLDTLLDEIALSRQEAYITNLLKYRPFDGQGGNRSPSVSEARYALPYLLEELKVLVPRVVVCLGLSSAKALLNDLNLKMGLSNGVVFQRHGLKILVTYHPSPFNYKVPHKRDALRAAFERLRTL